MFLSQAPAQWVGLYLLIPLLYLLPAGLAIWQRLPAAFAWRLAQRYSVYALSVALIQTVIYALLVGTEPVVRQYLGVAYGNQQWIGLSIRFDALTVMLSLLVTLIAWVIIRYSDNYLAGDKGRQRYLSWLLLTLAAVSLLVQLNNLVFIAAAWIATSLSLHQLLMFYRERLPAATAAHKKFLISRLADITLLAALILLGQHYSFELDVLAQQLSSNAHSSSLQWVAGLLALTAILKCAQLPFHGWLIQVMEAPTPISALLHAGIVNIGGFVLIRCASLLDTSVWAQGILVVFGSLTAVVAALVMTTRISIKVMLAWSTCAQMGFMLLQCGLGAYDLALLHLLAHSLYKAYAFLNAGDTVYETRIKSQVPALPGKPSLWLITALLCVLAGIVTAGWLSGWPLAGQVSDFTSTHFFYLVLALALPSALVPRQTVSGLKLLGIWVLGVAALMGLYTLWHSLVGHWVTPRTAALPAWQLILLVGLFGGLFLVNLAIQLQAHTPFMRKLYPHVFAGFYLDELFTRLTFLVWPMPKGKPVTLSHLPVAQSAEKSSS
ncbi:NADH-quinone oxidoreductase subunit L [Parvibium lacunae]|uniref:Probable inorganic carbon transporter subunit DabB n=1 Tax=Parvibium lacunae TaxID=1888893 RepID=A0A368L6M3_9BURK|nr:NADH-quinone oxidoreductase subunit L [Parvibium lacunae]RCS59303.1 NADH-quinone oxidoreductase subunit L [Parvibium lacunae]